jgi:hypothetical protein
LPHKSTGDKITSGTTNVLHILDLFDIEVKMTKALDEIRAKPTRLI